MKWLSGKTARWVLAVAATTAVAVAAGGTTQQTEPGEKIMNASCSSCHTLRPIQVQALDMDGWTNMVDSMVQKGAQVKADDVPVLVEYLARKQGPVPNGAGKAILLNTCTMCHELSRITQHGATREEWEDILLSMLNEGAPLSDDEFPVILNYLARNFRPQ